MADEDIEMLCEIDVANNDDDDDDDDSAGISNDTEYSDHADLTNICKRCSTPCDPYRDPGLTCAGDCERKFHIRCLDRGSLPGGFAGDVFFKLICSDCSSFNEEMLIRDKMPWLTTIILTLYNLREKSFGISKMGYFHWKSDISTFVDRNWEQLFSKSTKKKKNWIGTISGTLSHYKGIFFTSGKEDLDMGWWKLSSNDPPEILVERYNQMLEEKKLQQANNRLKRSKKQMMSLSPTPSESSVSTADSNGVCAKMIKIEDAAEEAVTKCSGIRESDDLPNDFLIRDDVDDIEMSDLNDISESVCSPMSNILGNLKDELPFRNDDLSDILTSHWSNESMEVSNNDVENVEKIKEENEPNSEEEKDDNDKEDSSSTKDIPKSLFTQSVKRDPPWEEYYLKLGEITPRMSEREEAYLLQKVNAALEKDINLIDTMSPKVRRLYRKLRVRQLKREYNLPLFDIDRIGMEPEVTPNVRKKGTGVLDRFCCDTFVASFEQRLQGHNEPTSVHSPFTDRLLKPFIRRDTTTRPLWLRLMSELLEKVNGRNPNWTPQPLEPIDYSYIRPQHVPAVNSLCSQFFWPGIDTTECLKYPDFTCVVLYKKLVIGFASLVPDAGYNEAYISFIIMRPEWRKSGIGTFMLYHLIQTCMGKDITLHVSATNPALVLYQKFGFKIEEFVQDFYDKYIDPFSKECRHALFLRLSR